MLYDFARLLLEGGQAKAVHLRPEQLPPTWLRAEEKRLDRKTCRTPQVYDGAPKLAWEYMPTRGRAPTLA